MPILCATRFNNDTFIEFTNQNQTQNKDNLIYNTPVKISETIFPDETIYVLEMNNSTNMIEGIGIIKNKCITSRRYKIYSDQNYNRYSYNCLYRIKRKDLTEEEEKIFKILDKLLFKGSRHFKRGHGIQKLPIWIRTNTEYNFTEFCKIIFKTHYDI
jgi:hypothetical protein